MNDCMTCIECVKIRGNEKKLIKLTENDIPGIVK